MNTPKKCCFCGIKLDPAKAIYTAGAGNGVAYSCDETCKELYIEEKAKPSRDTDPAHGMVMRQRAKKH